MRGIAFLLPARTAWTGAGRAAEHRQLPGPVLERRLGYVAVTIVETQLSRGAEGDVALRSLSAAIMERDASHWVATDVRHRRCGAKIASRARPPESSTVSNAAVRTAPSCAFTRSVCEFERAHHQIPISRARRPDGALRRQRGASVVVSVVHSAPRRRRPRVRSMPHRCTGRGAACWGAHRDRP